MEAEHFSYLFKVIYWNSCEDKPMEETAIVTNLSSYTEAVSKLEDYYGKDLYSFEAYCIDSPIAVIAEGALSFKEIKGAFDV